MKRGMLGAFVLVCILIFSSVNANDVVYGYHFDEKDNTGSEQEFLFVYDFVGGYHGLKGSYTYKEYPTSVAGKAGYGYRFDGNDKIAFDFYGSPPYFTEPFSFEVWIKPESGMGAKTILDSRNGILGINIYGCLYFVDPHVGILDSSFCNWNVNEWYHIGFVYDGDDYKLYVNNQVVGTKLYQTALSGDFLFNQMFIGVECTPGAYSPCNNHFIGIIDELKFYDYAKTSFDIGTNVAYKTESCEELSCASGLNCAEDFYYKKFDRCCSPGECVYDENCYGDGDEVYDNKYFCVNGEWRLKNKKVTGNKVLDLDLNEGSGSLANDISGFDNDGVLVGSPAPEWVSGGVDFSEDAWTPSERRKRILVANDASLNLDYSAIVEARVKYYALENAWCTTGGIVSKGLLSSGASTGPVGYHLSLGSVYSTTDKRFCFTVHTDMVEQQSSPYTQAYMDQQACSTTEYIEGQWYDLKGVYDGEYVGIYVNGVLEGKEMARGGIKNSDLWLGNYELIIGSQTYTTAVPVRYYTCGMNGVVDNVKIYDYAESLGTNIYLYNKCMDYMCVAELCSDPYNSNSCPAGECTQDSDCLPLPPPTCGDGNVDTGEKCDDANKVICDGCTGCVIDKCGDNLLCSDEQCEGSNLNSQTCTGLGFDFGNLACYSNCSLDTSGCSSAEVVSCSLKKAYWANANLTEYVNMQGVANNTLVFLIQELSGNCTDKGVDFKVYKNGGLYKSVGLIKVDRITNTAFSSWITNNHGNESEFYFTVELSGEFNTSNKIVITNDSEEGPGANCTSYGFKCCAANLCYQEISSLSCVGSHKCCYGCIEAFEGCGDGFIHEHEEDCDGLNLGGADCVSVSTDYIGGVLACYSNCTFDMGDCITEGIEEFNDTPETKQPGGLFKQTVSGDNGETIVPNFTIILLVILFTGLFLVFVYFLMRRRYNRAIQNLSQQPANIPRVPGY